MLIGAIYDAAIPGGCMESALEQIQSLTGVAGVSLINFDRSNGNPSETLSGTPTVMEYIGFPDDSRKAFCEYYFRINPQVESDINIIKPGLISYTNGTIRYQDWLRSEYYVDFMRLNSWGHSVGAYLGHTEESTLTLNASRFFKNGDFNADERKLWELLVPHFRRALSVRNEFNACQVEKKALCEGLDQLQTGVVLLDDTGNAVLVNTEARRLCRSEHGLSLKKGKLSVLNPTSDLRLQNAISNAIGCGRGTGEIGGTTVAIAHHKGKHPLAVQCIPVMDRMTEYFGSNPAAIVFIRDPNRPLDVSHELLQVLFNLTPTEALVAQKITDGKSLEECAQHFSQSIHTTRSHLKKVFCKTGVHGQVQLVSVVLKALST